MAISFKWLPFITPGQREQILDLFLSAFLAQGRESSERLTDYFNRKITPRLGKDPLIYSAFDKDRMVGFAIFEKRENRTYYLAEMAVLPNYQRQGIGKKLVFSIREKDPDCAKIFLVTEKAIPKMFQKSFLIEVGASDLKQRSGIEAAHVPVTWAMQMASKMWMPTMIQNRFLNHFRYSSWSQSFYERIGFKHSSFQHPDYPENFIGLGYELSNC